MQTPIDRSGKPVRVGDSVRLVAVSEQWMALLDEAERLDARSMLGGVFVVDEIDDLGRPCISKFWPAESDGSFRGHSIALDAQEFEVVTPTRG